MIGKWIQRRQMTGLLAYIETPIVPLIESGFVPALLIGPPPGKRTPGDEDEPDELPLWEDDDFEEAIPGEEEFEEEDWDDFEEEASAEEGLPGEGGTDNLP